MTDEDAFRAAINTAPHDATLRLVYCDWLAERGDPREAGHRFLAETGRAARQLTDFSGMDRSAWWLYFVVSGFPAHELPWGQPHVIHGPVYEATELAGKAAGLLPYYAALPPENHKGPRWAVEDAAAPGFGRLPADVRARLLAEGRAARDSRLSAHLPLLTEPV